MNMSDSDSENLTNAFSFQNESTLISARGPNINASNLTGISFRNNLLSSTITQMPKNFEWQRQTDLHYDQRSMYYRRETSPMSVMSAYDMRSRNPNNSYYTIVPRGMSSQRSIYNGRSGSPMSVRSIDSTASVSATDIAMAFKNVNFNKYDLKIIKNAYNQLMKHRVRKRIEKRRNLRLFRKGSRRKSGYDSGAQGSDSSISSDDRSTRTSNYKENMSTCRSTKTDFSDFRRTIKESNMYKDCTENFRQNSIRSMASGLVNLNNTHSSINTHRSLVGSFNMPSIRNVPANFNTMQSKTSNPITLQKDRFKNGFLLPSQRFNRSVANSAIPEGAENGNHLDRNNLHHKEAPTACKNMGRNVETDSDQDDIFSEVSNKKTIEVSRKRSFSSDDEISLPKEKRAKTASPCKNSLEVRQNLTKEPVNSNDKTTDFIFAKPSFPVRKSNLKAKEKILSKSNPSSDTIISGAMTHTVIQQHRQPDNQVEPERECDEEQSNVTQNTTDPSMRPSFIKRKLFTQKLDLAEKKNTSTDNFVANSPQNSIYSMIQKEKHKARKLQQVTTQSCLSRDMLQDENNLLDLIYKIVPQEQMNATNQTNKTDLSSKNKSEENEDKWDVTSLISTQNNNDNVSDTFTDEEIFNATVKQADNVSKKLNCSPKKHTNCKVVLEKLPANYPTQPKTNLNVENHDGASKTIQKCIKSFWDTDFESDVEIQPKSRNGPLKEAHLKDSFHSNVVTKPQGYTTFFNLKNNSTISAPNVSTFINKTGNGIQKFNSSSLKIRSHRTPNQKRPNKLSIDEDEKSAFFEPQIKKLNMSLSSSCNDLSKAKLKSQTVTLAKNSKGSKHHSQKGNQKSPKSNKSKSLKHNVSMESVQKTPQKQISNKAETGEQTELGSNKNKKDTLYNKQDTKKEIKQKNGADLYKGNSKNNGNVVHRELTKTFKRNKKQENTFDDKLNATSLPLVKNKAPKSITKPQKGNEIKRNNKTKQTAITTAQKKEQRILKRDSSVNLDSTTEENNNKSHRPIRSCRNSKNDSTIESKQALNDTLSRSLRSRQIDLSKPKVNETDGKNKSRLSDVSFSLDAKKNTAPKRGFSKISNSRILRSKDISTSDVSFSLKANDTPIAKKISPAKSRINSKARKKQSDNIMMSISIMKSDSKPIRNRVANKKYLVC